MANPTARTEEEDASSSSLANVMVPSQSQQRQQRPLNNSNNGNKRRDDSPTEVCRLPPMVNPRRSEEEEEDRREGRRREITNGDSDDDDDEEEIALVAGRMTTEGGEEEDGGEEGPEKASDEGSADERHLNVELSSASPSMTRNATIAASISGGEVEDDDGTRQYVAASATTVAATVATTDGNDSCCNDLLHDLFENDISVSTPAAVVAVSKGRGKDEVPRMAVEISKMLGGEGRGRTEAETTLTEDDASTTDIFQQLHENDVDGTKVRDLLTISHSSFGSGSNIGISPSLHSINETDEDEVDSSAVGSHYRDDDDCDGDDDDGITDAAPCDDGGCDGRVGLASGSSFGSSQWEAAMGGGGRGVLRQPPPPPSPGGNILHDVFRNDVRVDRDRCGSSRVTTVPRQSSLPSCALNTDERGGQAASEDVNIEDASSNERVESVTTTTKNIVIGDPLVVHTGSRKKEEENNDTSAAFQELWDVDQHVATTKTVKVPRMTTMTCCPTTKSSSSSAAEKERNTFQELWDVDQEAGVSTNNRLGRTRASAEARPVDSSDATHATDDGATNDIMKDLFEVDCHCSVVLPSAAAVAVAPTVETCPTSHNDIFQELFDVDRSVQVSGGRVSIPPDTRPKGDAMRELSSSSRGPITSDNDIFQELFEVDRSVPVNSGGITVPSPEKRRTKGGTITRELPSPSRGPIPNNEIFQELFEVDRSVQRRMPAAILPESKPKGDVMHEVPSTNTHSGANAIFQELFEVDRIVQRRPTVTAGATTRQRGSSMTSGMTSNMPRTAIGPSSEDLLRDLCEIDNFISSVTARTSTAAPMVPGVSVFEANVRREKQSTSAAAPRLDSTGSSPSSDNVLQSLFDVDQMFVGRSPSKGHERPSSNPNSHGQALLENRWNRQQRPRRSSLGNIMAELLSVDTNVDRRWRQSHDARQRRSHEVDEQMHSTTEPEAVVLDVPLNLVRTFSLAEMSSFSAAASRDTGGRQENDASPRESPKGASTAAPSQVESPPITKSEEDSAGKTFSSEAKHAPKSCPSSIFEELFAVDVAMSNGGVLRPEDRAEREDRNRQTLLDLWASDCAVATIWGRPPIENSARRRIFTPKERGNASLTSSSHSQKFDAATTTKERTATSASSRATDEASELSVIQQLYTMDQWVDNVVPPSVVSDVVSNLMMELVLTDDCVDQLRKRHEQGQHHEAEGTAALPFYPLNSDEVAGTNTTQGTKRSIFTTKAKESAQLRCCHGVNRGRGGHVIKSSRAKTGLMSTHRVSSLASLEEEDLSWPGVACDSGVEPTTRDSAHESNDQSAGLDSCSVM